MCAAPSVTCNSISGSTPTKTSITTRSWNQLTIPVSGEAWTPCMTKTYTFTGNGGTGLKYYLSSSDSNGIKHVFSVSNSYTDPTTISDSTKATYALTPKSVPGSPNLNDVVSGADTQYITEAKSVSSTATTGLNIQWVSTIYYLWV